MELKHSLQIASPEERLKTSLEKEIEKMQEIVEHRLSGYRPPERKGKKKLVEPADKIVQILIKHSREEILPAFEVEMKLAVEQAIQNDLPVPVTFLWPIGGQARNPLKLIEYEVNFPRLGDIWGLYWLDMLNRKIQSVYEKGCLCLIIDEQPQLELIGWKPEEISQRRTALQKLIPPSAFIKVVSLPEFQEVVEQILVDEPSAEEVFSILTCLSFIPHEILESKLSQLYVNRKKGSVIDIPDWAWDGARKLRIRMNQIGLARKQTRWIDKVLAETLNYSEEYYSYYIDGCLIEKLRWSPHPWGYTFPQHGGSLLDHNSQGRYSVKIVPEYRLLGAGHLPVYLSTKEFGVSNNPYQEFIFYWVKDK